MDGADPHWTALPEEQVFALPLADTRSPLSRVLIRPEGPNTRIDTALAADFPVLGWEADGVALQVGVDAAVYMDFLAGDGFTFSLQTLDGQFGLPVDLAWKQAAVRVQWTHLSAHYGDGVRYNDQRPTNLDSYSREYLWMLASGRLGPARVYGGGQLILHSTVPVPMPGLQLGAEAAPGWGIAPYVAADLQAHAEHDWRPALAAQVGGLARRGDSRFRLALAARTGPDDTGKMDGAHEVYLGVLFGFDRTGAIP